MDNGITASKTHVRVLQNAHGGSRRNGGMCEFASNAVAKQNVKKKKEEKRWNMTKSSKFFQQGNWHLAIHGITFSPV